MARNINAPVSYGVGQGNMFDYWDGDLRVGMPGTLYELEDELGGYRTQLGLEDEKAFRIWYRDYSASHGLSPDPDDEEHHYDYRGWWSSASDGERALRVVDPESHLPDTWKTPGHETFSDGSIYHDPSRPETTGGHWEGDRLVPPGLGAKQMGEVLQRVLDMYGGDASQALAAVRGYARGGGLQRRFEEGTPGVVQDGDIVYSGGVVRPSVSTAGLPSIGTTRGKRIARNMAERVASGAMGMDAVPWGYRSYVEGEVKGAMPVRHAINTTGVKTALGTLAVPATVIAGAELGGAAAPMLGGVGHALGNAARLMRPGSPFWTNPVTADFMKSTLGGLSVDAVSKATTGHTLGENIRGAIYNATGYRPESTLGNLLYDIATESLNPGYSLGSTRLMQLIPSPVIPAKIERQMNVGNNLGKFNAAEWSNWGSESLVKPVGDYMYKVSKRSTTPRDVGPKVFRDFTRGYKRHINHKLAANQIPSFEPYEYIGYFTTDKGITPVFRQRKLVTKGLIERDGVNFNREAMEDMEKAARNTPGLWQLWGVSDLDYAHNIGKTSDGVGRSFDAMYHVDPYTRARMNFPHVWNFNPFGSTRLIRGTLKHQSDVEE